MEFDPYRDLLQIASSDRPPNHYALLGLELFETDRSRIDEAAGERMAMLQELANSEHMDASQQLLNEVSAARRCLLDETRKIAYDEELRTRQKRASASSGNRRSKNKHRRQPPLMPVGVTALVVLILAGIFLLRRSPAAVDGNLVVNWPTNERQGAVVLVDGSPVRIPESQPMVLKIPHGRHRVVFQRSGFEEIPKTFEFSNIKVNMTLNWTPIRK